MDPNIHSLNMQQIGLPRHKGISHAGASVVADRMYQIAALTAGFFLLATLL